MSEDVSNLFDDPRLLRPPVKRAAYSDRTAWLMSAMSELAYYPFEGDDAIMELAKELAQMSGVEAIKERLDHLMKGSFHGGNEDTLRGVLSTADFELISTYNSLGTQAFLAKKESNEGEGMLVLAFRGTEFVARDIHADVDATLVKLSGEERVHHGFYSAFNQVKDSIKQDLKSYAKFPLYITGHSLGGALAILATRLLAKESQGACYTFGSPRVGNYHFDEQIKTPIYRVVNAADLVPRVPPSFIISFFIQAAKFFHLTPLAKFLRRFKGYVHCGDMRYLSGADAGPNDRFPGLVLHSNPSWLLRFSWLVRRWLATSGHAAVGDHSIDLYRKKLKAYALTSLS